MSINTNTHATIHSRLQPSSRPTEPLSAVGSTSLVPPDDCSLPSAPRTSDAGKQESEEDENKSSPCNLDRSAKRKRRERRSIADLLYRRCGQGCIGQDRRNNILFGHQLLRFLQLSHQPALLRSTGRVGNAL
eukprot:764310-Hanusia_phi.AAC.3